MKRSDRPAGKLFRHKLNMLGPGTILFAVAAALAAAGLLLDAAELPATASAAFLLAGTTFAVLLILVAVELHQDRVLNDAVRRENTEDVRRR